MNPVLQMAMVAAGIISAPVVTDPYFNNVVLLMHMDGANAGTTFTDVKGKIPSRINAPVTSTTVSPKFGTSSFFVPGASNYISFPYSTDFQLDGNFTIECWVYFTSLAGNYYSVMGNVASGNTGAGGWEIQGGADGSIGAYFGGASGETNHVYTATGTMVTGQWYHLAYTRSGTTATFWLNGVSVGTRTISGAFMAAYPVVIGGRNISAGNVSFYIDEVRITKGVARYTANFTPSTIAFPDTLNASFDPFFSSVGLLLHGSTASYTDIVESAGSLSVTNTAVTLKTANPKFDSAAAEFNGTTSRLQVPTFPASILNSTVWTIEGWVYVDSAQTNATFVGGAPYHTLAISLNRDGAGQTQVYVGNGSSWTGGTWSIVSSTPLTMNAWRHIALVRNGSTLTLYQNGNSVGSTGQVPSGFTDGLNIGSLSNATDLFKGLMDEVRVTSGVARYSGATYTIPTSRFADTVGGDASYASVSLLMHMNSTAIPTTVTDVKGNALSHTGVEYSNTQAKFGTASIRTISSATTLTIPDTANLVFGTGDFTVEGWFYQTADSTYPMAFEFGINTSTGIAFITRNGGDAKVYGAGFAGAKAASLNTWNHIAWVRSGGILNVFVNGEGGTPVSYTTNLSGTTPLSIGGSSGRTGANAYQGHLEELRVTKGVARYHSNFTPPTAPFPDA